MTVLKITVLLLGTTLFIGCRSTSTSETGPPAAALPPCANVSTVISRPPEFPNDFPLPDKTVITASQYSLGGSLTISAAVPMTFKEAATFFQNKLPAAGYKLLEGDAEMDEAEATFAGNGYQGKWKVNGILNCPRAVRLTIAIAKI
jgi:hypothetical protein